MNEREQLGYCSVNLPPGGTLNDIDERFGDAEDDHDTHELRRRVWREREAKRKRRLRQLMRGNAPPQVP